MNKYYDVVCFGFGAVTRYLIKFFPNFYFLIISNSCTESFPNAQIVNYSKFFKNIDSYVYSNVIFSTRLDVLNMESQELIFGSEELWGNLRQSKILLLSSVSIYGSGKHIHTEADVPNPLNIYATSKIVLEQLFTREVPPENLLILRIANLYGVPGVSGFFDQLRESVTNGQTLSLPNFDCFRDFVNIFDLFQFIDFWINSRPIIEYPILNFATGSSHSLKEVVQWTINLSSATFAISYQKESPVIPISRICIDRLRKSWSHTMTELKSDGLSDILFA